MRQRVAVESPGEHESELEILSSTIDRYDKLLIAIRVRSAVVYECESSLAELPGISSPKKVSDTLRQIRDLSVLPDPDGVKELEHSVAELKIQAARNATHYAFPRTAFWNQEYQRQLDEGHRQLAAVHERRAKPLSDAWARLRSIVENGRKRQCVVRDELIDQQNRIRYERIEHFARLISRGLDRQLVDRGKELAWQCLANDKHAFERATSLQQWPSVLAEVYGAACVDKPPLSDDDVALCREWSGEVHPTRYEVARLESARRAEKAMYQLYSKLTADVEDLSILQRIRPADVRWKSADIRAGQQYIDIKNSRTSYSSPQTYSEHCVPQCKQDRTGSDVIVSGVLSPFWANSSDPLIWLGETTNAIIDSLRLQFESERLQINFAKRHDKDLLPPWIFDYPKNLYVARDALIRDLQSESFDWPLAPCPAMLAAFLPVSESHENNSGPVAEAALLRKMLASARVPTRPMLFLHVLDRFCLTARSGKPFPYADLHTVLFGTQSTIGTQSLVAPLLVYDPMQTVSSLLGVLKTVSDGCNAAGLEFTSFRLRGMNILQGQTVAGRWQTLVAYCGGWTKRNGGPVKCGKIPLCFGQDEPCQECLNGKLICGACGFCSASCSLCRPRQDSWTHGDSDLSRK